jgi:hypothetical protein
MRLLEKNEVGVILRKVPTDLIAENMRVAL